jgi:adenine-specific DNA-methyltransferase
MYPRLRAAIALLADDGFLAISISDVELANLRLVLDEIMGPDTFVECFVWESIFRPSNMSKRTRKNAEYVLLYVKNSLTAFELIERLQDPQGDASLTQNNNAARTLRFPPSSLDCSIPDGTYTATDTADLEILEPLIVRGGKNASSFVVEGKLKWSQSYLDAEIAKGVTLKIKSTSLIPYYRKDYQQTALRPKKLIPNDLVADVLAANAEQAKLFDKQVFDYPKPTSLIEYFINSLPLAPDATILDFFAGSGTTGHAVWKSNAASGAKRRLVLIQLDAEVDMGTTTGQNALSLGLDTLDKITCERLRRASKAMKAAGATGDLGFRVFKEDSPALVRPLHLAQQQLQKGNLELFNEKRALIQPAALFAEVLLLLGFPLDSKREQVPQDSANTLWRFEHPRVPQPLLLCLDQKIDDNLLDALKDQRKHTFVCRDEALTDVAKARFYDALKRIDSTFKVL